jgi:hypothetical protein
MFLMPPSDASSLSRSRCLSRISFFVKRWVLEDLLELLQPFDRGLDRLEVREHAAEPAVVHVEHPAALGLLADLVLRLLLRADEEDDAARRGELPHLGVDLAEHPHGLLEIDDVDPVAGAEDVALHLRVPSAGLVAEVHSRLQQLLHRRLGHTFS